MNRSLTFALCVIASASLLGGCGYMRSKFGSKPDAYKKSTQTRPLEVPPDLERPNSSGTLVIPERGAPGATTASSAVAPPSGSPGDAVPRMATGPALAGDGLRVADTVASTWARIGLALERSGAATIEAKDEAAHTYSVRTSATTSERPGWFKRAITFGRAADRQVSTPVTLGIRVAAEGDGSKVTIEGANDSAGEKAARDLLETLRQRLT